MATIAQIQANRLNAQHSTGPRSDEGKASSRFNAFKHGADARARVIPGEDEADLLEITRQYYEEFRPEGIVETELVDTLIRCHWEKHRIPILEAAVVKALVATGETTPDHALGAAIVIDADGPNALHKLFRRAQAANRDWFRAEAELRRRQAERLSRPANPDPPAAAAPDPTESVPPPPEPPVRNEPNPGPAPTAAPAPEQTRSVNPRSPHDPCPSVSIRG
jgi:hypothetical protein